MDMDALARIAFRPSSASSQSQAQKPSSQLEPKKMQSVKVCLEAEDLQELELPQAGNKTARPECHINIETDCQLHIKYREKTRLSFFLRPTFVPFLPRVQKVDK